MMTPEDHIDMKNAQPTPSPELVAYAKHKGHMKPVPWASLPQHIKVALTKDKDQMHLVSRNSPCPCNSGRRFKRCCMDKDSK